VIGCAFQTPTRVARACRHGLHGPEATNHLVSAAEPRPTGGPRAPRAAIRRVRLAYPTLEGGYSTSATAVVTVLRLSVETRASL